LNDDLVNDIERFAAYVERLRRSLDSSTSVPGLGGEPTIIYETSGASTLLIDAFCIYNKTQMENLCVFRFTQRFQWYRNLYVIYWSDIRFLRLHKFFYQLVSSFIVLKCSNDQAGSGGLRNGRGVLTRRHSTYQRSAQDNEYDIDEIDKMVADRADGIDIAFDRGKAWSKYCKELLNFVSRRVQLELDHAKKVHSLANQSKVAINEHFLPLRDVFESSFDNDVAFCEQTYDAVKHIQDRFIKSLEMRRDDHERQRRALKNEWMRVAKQLKDTQQELIRARSLLDSRDDGYRRAQESFLRTESTGPAVGVEMIRRKKELERRRKNEEEAFTKREEAQNQVEKLEGELERREQLMEDTKVRIVGQLRELVYRCDQTTKACSTHYFQALANLWVAQPGKYHEFADATRTYTPGAEYMSFLQNLPHRTVSSGSLFRTAADNDDVLSSANHTASSSSVSSQRRNAIDVFDHEMILERKQKKSSVSVRLLDQSTTETSAQHTEAAKSHRLQRIRQPTKCSNCDTLSILSTVQCLQCGMVFHKSCLSKLTIFCGQSSKGTGHSSLSGAAVESDYAAAASRRMSIFGVSLKGHLDGQNRKVPLIVEKCVDELQRRGLKVKGIYRTCGVKSKIEQICEEFERSPNFVDIDLSVFHPMNIASVIKLYLRKLPEPLLTHELYNEWILLATGVCIVVFIQNLNDGDECITEQIRCLLHKLPEQNFDTLQFLLLHLNRVTWFEMDNLMTASNLGAVISPSMIWMHPYIPSCSNKNSSFLSDAHLLSKAVELLIKNAFEVFNVDRAEDWHDFFQNYPEIEQPPAVDPETEAHIGEGEDEGCLLSCYLISWFNNNYYCNQIIRNKSSHSLVQAHNNNDIGISLGFEQTFYSSEVEPQTVIGTAQLRFPFAEENEDEDLLEDEADTDVLCGGSFVPQPPTPDLLKNTSRGKNESYSTSDDLDLDSSLGSFVSGGGGHCGGSTAGPGGGCSMTMTVSNKPQQNVSSSSSCLPTLSKNQFSDHNQLTSTLSTPLSLLTTKDIVTSNDNDEQVIKQSSFLQPQIFDASYCRDKTMKDKSLHQQQQHQTRSYTTSILVAPHSESHCSSNSTSTTDNFITKTSPSSPLATYKSSSNGSDNVKNNRDSSQNIAEYVNTFYASASGSSTYSTAATGIVGPCSISSTLNDDGNNNNSAAADYGNNSDDNDLLSIVLSAADKLAKPTCMSASDDKVNNKPSNASSCLTGDVTFDGSKGASGAVAATTLAANNNKNKKTDNNGDNTTDENGDQDITDNDSSDDEAANKSGTPVELEISKESDKLRTNPDYHHKHYYDASDKLHCCLHKRATTLLTNQVAVAEKRDESDDDGCCCDKIRRDKTLLQSPSLAGTCADIISRATSEVRAKKNNNLDFVRNSNKDKNICVHVDNVNLQRQYCSEPCNPETSSYCNIHRLMNSADSNCYSCRCCCCCCTSSSRTTCTCNGSPSLVINTTPKQPNLNVNVDICRSTTSDRANTQTTTSSSSKKCSVVSDDVDPIKNGPLIVHNSTRSDSTSPSSSSAATAGGGDGSGGGSSGQRSSQSDKISLQSIRVLFTGTDVSYV
uniref:F-BAR domain-containing protein n=1 Tax=Anisakis simplex TaxID=6269 RepID=A0A158PNM3_ANISI